jgi:hypothetical protein
MSAISAEAKKCIRHVPIIARGSFSWSNINKACIHINKICQLKDLSNNKTKKNKDKSIKDWTLKTIFGLLNNKGIVILFVH